jgi:hypothetical protein
MNQESFEYVSVVVVVVGRKSQNFNKSVTEKIQTGNRGNINPLYT